MQELVETHDVNQILVQIEMNIFKITAKTMKSQKAYERRFCNKMFENLELPYFLD